MKDETKLRFCTYGVFSTIPDGFGMCMSFSEKGTCYIYDNESDAINTNGQYEPWDLKYVKVFEEPKEALEFYLKNKPSGTFLDHKVSDERMKKMLEQMFSSLKKKE